jgi:hypothetical protein
MATKRTNSKNRPTKGRTSTKRKTSQTLSTADRAKDFLDVGDKDYKEVLKELITSPAVKYVAGGIATAILTRIANKMGDRYPEISSFLKENLDSLSGKMGEFRNNLQGRTHH